MSKNTFYALLGGLIALWLGGISGAFVYALITLLMLSAGFAFDFIAAFTKGFRDGMGGTTHPYPPPKRERPHLRLVK